MDAASAQVSRDLIRIKGSDRIEINNILSAVCIGVLSVLLGLSKDGLNVWMIGQIALAIPCLVTSSLAYAKTCYRDRHECHIWDAFGWATHSLAYILILNALSIALYYSGQLAIAWIFVAVALLLFVLYSVLDIVADKRRLVEKASKLLFYIVLLLAGSVVPIMLGWA